MGKYGEAAILAVESLARGASDPREAWNGAAKQVFPDSVSSQVKGCPRGAFLGLFYSGRIRGVQVSSSGSMIGANGTYAVEAARLLAERPDLALLSKSALWSRVMASTGSDPSKQHNGQMDVVLSLHAYGMLVAE